jgi:hypothetical protein
MTSRDFFDPAPSYFYGAKSCRASTIEAILVPVRHVMHILRMSIKCKTTRGQFQEKYFKNIYVHNIKVNIFILSSIQLKI